MTTSANTISSINDFEKDPTGQADRWDAEMAAADKEVEKWLKDGRRLIDRFRDNRTGRQNDGVRLNIFSANVTTMRDMLYGQMPSVDAKRRFDDFNDDVGRVAGTILQRMLNNDIQRDSDPYTDVLRHALDDRLIPGLGCARVRYEAEFEEEEVEAMMGFDDDGVEIELAEAYVDERKVWEDAVVDYVHWADVRWSPARTWGEVRWVSFRAYLTQDQMAKRFGETVAKAVPYGDDKGRRSTANALEFDAWKRCQVWEIWCKTSGKVYWWVKGYSRILDCKEDPLELEGFFPCPKFLLANSTTNTLVPVPDFHLCKDLYNEIDYVSTRIEKLERAIKAVGVYDKSATGVQRMMQEGFDNDLIPVDNWAMFAEKGGIQGTVQWMPLSEIVQAMDKLREYRKEQIDLLYQISGMSDIMRGQASTPNVTATEQGLKARYASVRITSLQDQFADFASQLQQLRAEIIVKHFDDETILQRSNIMETPDKPYVPQALALLRSQFASYRIEIEPDNIARADYAALKNDRVEYVTAIGQFIGQVLPLAEKSPEAAGPLIEIVKWLSTGFRGGAQVEAVLDQALNSMQQKAKQPQGKQQPPPEVQAEQMRQQAEQQRAQMRLQEAQMKAQAKLQEEQAKHRANMIEMDREFQLKMREIEAELQADLRREQAQAEMGSLENIAKEQAKTVEEAERTRFRPIQGGRG